MVNPSLGWGQRERIHTVFQHQCTKIADKLPGIAAPSPGFQLGPAPAPGRSASSGWNCDPVNGPSLFAFSGHCFGEVLQNDRGRASSDWQPRATSHGRRSWFAQDALCLAVRAGEVNTTAYRSSLSSSRRALSLRTSASASCRAAASQLSSASALSSLATASRRAQDIGKVLKQGEPVRVSRPHGGRTQASAQSPIEADRKLINLAGYQIGTSEREIPSGNCQPKR